MNLVLYAFNELCAINALEITGPNKSDISFVKVTHRIGHLHLHVFFAFKMIKKSDFRMIETSPL